MNAFSARSVEPGSRCSPNELAQKALQANIAHQHALTKYAGQLEAELQELDNLITAVDTSEDGDGELEAEVIIPGAKKPAGPCPSAEFLNPKSPFFGEASQRTSCLNNTTIHPMKASELDTLAEAVRNENQRLQAYELYRKGQGLTARTQIDIDNNTEGLDWVVIAEKVSSVSTVKRTVDQCRIKWLGDRHPRINHGEWSPAELDKTKDIIDSQRASEGKVDWVRVANELGTNRTPIDCMRHGIPRQRHTWNQTSDEKLLDAVKRYGNNNWSVVARFVSEDATASQCQSRYSRLDTTLKRGKWSKEEDSRLELAFKAYGNSWVEVAACIPGRTNGQCREHWSELSCSRAQWTEEEEKSLKDAVSTMGNSWTKIAEQLGHGRTGQQCRLRYDKLKKLQLSTDAGASIPRDDPTEVEGTRPARRRERISNSSKISAPCGDAQPAPAPKARPRPRPIGKGKTKAKETDPRTAESDNPDETISVNDTGITTVSTKRKRNAKNLGEEAPAPKKRKSVKAKGNATVAVVSSETAPIGRRSSMPILVGTRSSPRKNAVRAVALALSTNQGDSDLGSSFRNRTDHGEGESETGTTSMAADVPRLPPKPRGRPKVNSRLPPTSTIPRPSTNADPSAVPGGDVAIPKAAGGTKQVVGPTMKSIPKRLHSTRVEDEAPARDHPDSDDGGGMPRNISLQACSAEVTEQPELPPIEGRNVATSPRTRRLVRGTMRSNVPRRQSARVAARCSLPHAIIGDDVVGADSSFSPEAAQAELRSNATSPLTDLEDD